MPHRAAKTWTGSTWDDIGDSRMLTHNHNGGASGSNIPQSAVTNLSTDLALKSPNYLTINAQTNNYTLVLGDASKQVEMSLASANTITVPANSSVAFPIGTTILVVQTGVGQTTISPSAGVTINGTPGMKLRAQWSAATLVKRATDTWLVFGDLSA